MKLRTASIVCGFACLFLLAPIRSAMQGMARSGVGGDIPSVAAGATAGRTVRVPRWQPWDFVFSSDAKPANPFTLAFSATVKGPAGVSFRTAGFYDGGRTWKVRLYPTAEGEWSLVTQSEAPDLDGRTARFVCVKNPNARVHGGLRVDPLSRNHFVFEDGTRHFLMGYECDWLWALDLGKPALGQLNSFLDKLASNGFNHLILNAYAHDTNWRKEKTGPDDFGPPPLYAWEGDNAKPDHSRLHLAFWRHYDRVIQALHHRGIIAHIMIKVYNKLVNWPLKGSRDDDLYFGWLVARYAAFSNVVWDFSKEAHNEKDLEYKIGRLRFLKEHDPYQRLRTVHDDDGTYAARRYDELLDFRSDQQHKDWREIILAQRTQHVWPAVNVEFGYEHGPGGIDDKTYNVVQAPEEVCRRAWEICMAGGYGAYYYTYTAWDVIRPQDAPPGYAYFKHLRQFFENAAYWLMTPADGVVSEGYCLANPGKEYLVFLNEARPFSLKLEGLSAPLRAAWFQPLTGKSQEAGRLENGSAQLMPPASWGTGPVALHVGQLRGSGRSTKN